MARIVRNATDDIESKNEADSKPVPQNIWRSCCLETDRRAVIYFGQLAFSFSVLGFSAVMLVMADGDCNKGSPYIGLISFLLGKLLSSVTDAN
jgi:hypothetical protein